MSLSALEANEPEAVMLSQDAEKPTIGTIQEYPLQPDPDGTTGNIDASQEYNRLKTIQYTDHEHGLGGTGPGVTDKLPHERTLPTMPKDYRWAQKRIPECHHHAGAQTSLHLRNVRACGRTKDLLRGWRRLRNAPIWHVSSWLR